MSTRIFGLLLSVRNCYASMKMATEPTLLLQHWSEGRQSLPRSEENIISLLSLSTPGRLNHLLSNRIQTLPWGFSARPSLLLLISICSVLELKFRRLQSFARKNFLQFKFSCLGVLCEICKTLHHTKISHYTVLSFACNWSSFQNFQFYRLCRLLAATSIWCGHKLSFKGFKAVIAQYTCCWLRWIKQAGSELP